MTGTDADLPGIVIETICPETSPLPGTRAPYITERQLTSYCQGEHISPQHHPGKKISFETLKLYRLSSS